MIVSSRLLFLPGKGLFPHFSHRLASSPPACSGFSFKIQGPNGVKAIRLRFQTTLNDTRAGNTAAHTFHLADTFSRKPKSSTTDEVPFPFFFFTEHHVAGAKLFRSQGMAPSLSYDRAVRGLRLTSVFLFFFLDCCVLKLSTTPLPTRTISPHIRNPFRRCDFSVSPFDLS